MGTAATPSLMLLRSSILAFMLASLPGAATAFASFSLFLPAAEVRNLLGVSREIYYVDDGNIRENALKFPLSLSQELDHIHFSWFAKNKVSYSIRMTTSDPEALLQPHLNISHSGQIPAKSGSTFRVTLPCSGAKAAKVLVTIDITVTEESGTRDSRILRIFRQKDCALDGSVQVVSLEEDARIPPHVVFAGILLGALAIVLLIVLIIVTSHLRKRKSSLPPPQPTMLASASREGKNSSYSLSHFQYPQLQQGGVQQQQQQPMHYEPVGQHELPYMQDLQPPPLPPLNPPPPPLLLMHRANHLQQQSEPAGLLSDAESRVTDWVQSQQQALQYGERDPDTVMQLLEVDRLRLKLGQLLLEGTFGRVYQGTLLNGDDREEDVFIKTVIAGSSSSQSQTLIKEGTALQGMAHSHIQTLLASTWDGTSPMLVYPYLVCGNLKKWLLQNNHGGVSTHVLVSLGLQMLKAMQHLHKRKILHKDIATRNCFLGDGNLLKLADGALSRDLFPSDYHCLGDNENRPIKWMPMEAIAQKKYSRASDVWSFGVFLWELMTRSQQPFSDVDPFEMESYLYEGYRLHQPLNCPDQLYSVLASCWSARAVERATVHALYNHLQTLQRQLQQFV